MDNPTPEQIARHYSAMLDSVNLINGLAPTTDTDNLDTLDRNVRHLEHMLERNWWAGYDLAPINAAIAAGRQ
jgi:hypothetical protein